MKIADLPAASLIEKQRFAARARRQLLTFAGDFITFQGQGPQPHFGQSGKKPGDFLRRMILLLAFLASSSPVAAQFVRPSVASAAPPLSASSDCVVEIAPGTRVNAPGDIPNVNGEMTQLMTDVGGGQGLLSDAARLQVCAKLQQFYNDGYGEMKLIIIPRTDASDLQTLGYNLFNQNLHLGNPDYNDGLLPIINAERFRDKQRGMMSIVPGDYYYPQFNANSQLQQAVGEQALSYLDQAIAARNSGDLAAAQRYTDQAVLSAIDIFINYAKDYRNANPPVSRAEREAQEAARREEEAARTAALLQFLAMLGVGVVVVGGAGFAGYQYYRRRKSLDEAVAIVSKPMVAADSPYKVTRGNVYSLQTLKHLFEDTDFVPDAQRNVNPRELLEAIDTVLEGLEARAEKKQNWKEVYAQVVELFVQYGLVHDQPEIRLNTVNRMIEDGLTRDDFEPFMTLLETETDDRVIQALMDPISKLTSASEAPQFRELLKNSPQAGVRAVSVAVMSRYANADTLGEFLTALEREQDPGNVEILQQAITNVAQANQDGLLLANIDKAKPEKVRAAAIMALTRLAKPKHFDALYQAFTADKARGMREYYRLALLATVSKREIPTLFAALNGDTRQQEMGIALLGKLKAPESVEPLLEYLGTEDTRFPNEAIEVVVSSVQASQADRLREIIHSNDPKTDDVEVMTAAVKALASLNLADDLDNFFEALAKGQAPNITQMLMQAIEDSPLDRTSQKYLEKVLDGHSDSGARIAAIMALDDYGQSALDPLFRALEASTARTPSGEVDMLRKSIMKIGRDESNLDYMLKKSLSRNEQARDVATRIVVAVLEDWDRRFDYDDDKAMRNLANLSRFENDTIAQKARRIREEMIEDKARALSNIGSSGSFHDSGNFSTLRRYSSASESSVASAARSALQQLERRKDAWEEAERRRRAEEERRRQAAAEAARRAAEAARRSSSMSTGFRSGGGGSRGGGTSW